jgi:hypothetical protein
MNNLQGTLAKDNDGIHYLLTVIDYFNKYAWVVLLKDKKAESIVKVFKLILEEAHPNFLQVDKSLNFIMFCLKSY